ncbi:hypothetical protein TrVE_jg6073 [Triparma verrucosa]|uniref:Protein-S-isoprenylcysteine O-methyltransferase n=1 Tax=Triparma verrucosa TaxID=1606542 RepID=A0A9W7F1E2_9STRA|nr:hypothetical protein TrVE_jg6073 [Triparma verrucosa]
MDIIKLFIVSTAERWSSALQAAPTSSDQLSVGLGGDIPIFPPIFVLICLLSGILLKLVLPKITILPSLMNKTWLRYLVFFTGFVGFGLTIQATEAELVSVKTSANFQPVKAIATSGIFAYSRNPIYVMGSVWLTPCLCIALNSLYVVFTMSFMIAYLVFIVIPTEEEFLSRQIGAAYDQYLLRTPRYLPSFVSGFVIFTFVAHLAEFFIKFKLFKSGKQKKTSMFVHFMMTFAWGVIYWMPFERDAEEKKMRKKKN